MRLPREIVREKRLRVKPWKIPIFKKSGAEPSNTNENAGTTVESIGKKVLLKFHYKAFSFLLWSLLTPW